MCERMPWHNGKRCFPSELTIGTNWIYSFLFAGKISAFTYRRAVGFLLKGYEWERGVNALTDGAVSPFQSEGGLLKQVADAAFCHQGLI